MRKKNFASFLLLALVSTPVFAEEKFSQLKADMEFLTDESLGGRKVSTVGEDISALYIKSRFNGLGYQSVISSFSIIECWKKHKEPVNGKNVLAWLDGTGRNRQEIIAVSAHFDGVGSSSITVRPAADDNASGTVALLALAEKLKSRKWNRSILLVAFGGEEAGLCGSIAYVQKVSTQNFRYAINMDMVGRPLSNSALTIQLIGNDDNPALESAFTKAALRTQIKLVLGSKLKEQPWWRWSSDHRSFHKAGVPAVMVMDANPLDLKGQMYIHTSADIKENINYDYLNQVIHLVFEALRRLDSK